MYSALKRKNTPVTTWPHVQISLCSVGYGTGGLDNGVSYCKLPVKFDLVFLEAVRWENSERSGQIRADKWWAERTAVFEKGGCRCLSKQGPRIIPLYPQQRMRTLSPARVLQKGLSFFLKSILNWIFIQQVCCYFQSNCYSIPEFL